MSRSSPYKAQILEALDRAKEGGSEKRRCECPACPDRAGTPDKHQRSLVVKASGWADCYRCGFTTFLDGYAAEDYAAPEREELTEEEKIPEGFDFLYGRDAGVRLSRARRYLEKRGLSPRVLKKAHVGATLDGFYHHRIVVPIFGNSGGWVGFSARTWKPGVIPAYRYPPWMKRAEILYNAQALDVATDKPALVVEGVFDALALWPDGVASLGDISPQQMAMFAASRRPVVFVPDGDAWRKGAAHAMALGLRGVRAGALRLSPGCDPDELDRAEIEAAALQALAMAEDGYEDSCV